MLRSCAVVWTTCLLATAWGRYLSGDEYGTMQMQGIETETATRPIENRDTGSQQVQQMGYAYGNQQQTTSSSQLPPTSAPTQMLDIPMTSENNNYNQYSAYGLGYDEDYNSGASGEESGSGLMGFDPLSEDGEGSGEGSGSFSPSDCPHLSNGNYPLSACSTQFLSCSNGLPFIMDCPEQLVYNWDVDQCDWPHNLNCTDEGDSSGEGSGDFHGPSDCPNRADGNYAMSACGRQFLTCSNGNPFIFDCPAELVYNPQHDMCDWPSNMGCENPEEEESGSGSGSGEGSGDFHGPSDCPNLADGNYAMSDCGHQFLACSNGLPHVMDCPANLIYSAEFDMCDWPSNMGCEGSGGEIASDVPISEESGSGAASGEESGEFSGEEGSGEESGLTPIEPMPLPRPSATTTRPVATSTAPIIQEESTPEGSGLELLPSTSGEPETETSGMEETTRSAESSSTVAETEFSGEEGSAELSGEEGSSGIETEAETTTAMPTSTSTQSGSTIISIVVRHGQPDESLPSQATDCSTRADGNYELDRCSSRFVSCSKRVGHLMSCPDQLIFNARLNACDFPSPLMCDDNSAGSGLESDAALCSTDGVFATESCSPNFHNCINGQLFDLSCDPGQLFSWTRERCLPATEFPECDLH